MAPRKVSRGICFPCAQQVDPAAQWRRVESLGSSCTQCGEKPQGLFVKLVGSKDLAEKSPGCKAAQVQTTSQQLVRTESEQLEHEALQCAIFQSLQSTPEVLSIEACEERTLEAATTSTGMSSSSSRETPHRASSLAWLANWLESVGLREHFEAAAVWCESMGAVEVYEILDNADDFSEHLQLSASEHALAFATNNQSSSSTASLADPSLSWLADWLESVGLHGRFQEANAWCVSMGAVEATEILDNLDDFAGHLKLSDSVRERIPALSRQAEFHLAMRADSSEEEHQGPEDCKTFGPTDARYTILEQLGRGATATVYKCQRGAEFYAAKAIDIRRIHMSGNSGQIMDMLSREISLLRTLHHRRIVRLHDVVDTPTKRFLVMDLVDGGDLLHHILSQEGRIGLDEAEARHVFVQVVDGLRYIHSKNVVHRDLKPDNILIDSTTSHPGLPDVKLSDFGFSKQIRDGYTRPHTVLGTPQYWAPEVSAAGIFARSYDERADLWSLGVVLYVMLMGKYPFSSGSPFERRENFVFRGSRETEELVRGLIRQEPADRMSLQQCLESPWLVDVNQLTLTTDLSVSHVLVRLPRAPANVTAIKSALASYSCCHKVSANLQLLDIIVSFSPGVSGAFVSQTKSELMELLMQHVPDLKMQEEEDALPPATGNAAYDEESESLGFIYGTDFEAISRIEWTVRLQDGVTVRIYLPAGYPNTQPPRVEIESPAVLLPADLTASIQDHWTAGCVCVYQCVEHIREKLPPVPVISETTDGQTLAKEGEDLADNTFEFRPPGRGARGQKRHSKKFCGDSADPRHMVAIQAGTELEDRKSRFQAHGAHVTSREQVEWVWRTLLSLKKIEKATHNVVAFRYRDGEQNVITDCDSDDEDGAGRELAHVLEQRQFEGVFVMVSRWYGGQKLGSDRYRRTKQAAVKLLEDMGLILPVH